VSIGVNRRFRVLRMQDSLAYEGDAMNDDSLRFLRDLMNTPSPSGYEQEAQRLVRNRVKDHCDRIETDVHGNLIMARNEKAPLRVMLAAHVDEIGFMVRHIDDHGFLTVSAIGGVDEVTCAGRRLTIRGRSGPVRGVIGRQAIPLMTPEERKKTPPFDELWVDIGATDRKDAERAVSVGDVGVLDADFQELRNGIVAARAFDDRIGVFIVCEVLRRLPARRLPVAVFGVSTVQEEIGIRGAKTSAYRIKPDVALAIEVGFATDHPHSDKPRHGDVRMGAGPTLHRGANINPVVDELLVGAARRLKIPVQRRAEPAATGTDANAIQLNESGVATGLVTVPNRYMHSPVELVHLEDVDNCIRLLIGFLEGLSPRQRFIPA
jgi:putative aminopeptidase FrvX